jgi:hypothetical protein
MSNKFNIIPGPNIYNTDDIIIKLIDPNSIIKMLKNNSIIIPPFQRDLDEDKIKYIQEKILKNSNTNWLLKQGRINFGLIESTDKLYVLDGQHRIRALEQLITMQKELNIDTYQKPIEVIIIKFDKINSMKEHFLDININSKIEPIYTYFNNEIIQSTILNLKNWLKESYSTSFRRATVKTDTTHNYSIAEFISKFDPEDVKIFFNDNKTDYGDVELLVEKILMANLFVKEKLSKLQSTNARRFYISDKDYDKCLANNFYLAYDQINCIDWILNKMDDIDINTIYKDKVKINSKMRKEVWKKRNGTNMIGSCFTCDCELEFDNFHCGHIIPESEGGATLLNNLEPICMNCNLTMGTKNLLKFKEDLINFKDDIKYINTLSENIGYQLPN